jgi:phosphatidylserine/phosphatidylglycerophosphate/cardiolipin synthase-like enzyme
MSVDGASTPERDQVVRFRIALADSPIGRRNRIVIYDWFARGPNRAPPRGGHDVEILIDGEQTWARVAEDLERATREVQISTWMARPDIELLRPLKLALSDPAARTQMRLGAMLERRAADGVAIRLLIWGLVYTPIVDRWLRRWYWQRPVAIDVIEQEHPHVLGSIHQKTITIDGRIGYCGGMNLKQNDWDTSEHAIFEPRRNPYSAGAIRRTLVAGRHRRAAYAPRHDLAVRIEGPAVADLLDDFDDRWAQAVREHRRSFAGRLVDRLRKALGNDAALELPPRASVPGPSGNCWVQVVRTTPGGEDGVLGAYVRAIRNARRYIYIENQYFRSPLIGEELREALRNNPALRLAVVVRPVNDGDKSLIDPSGYWTAHTLELIREVRPQFQLTRLIVWAHDAEQRLCFQDVDVHAKIMIIDDVWLTVGSANIHDRGFRSEGEINVVVLDKPRARELRKRLMAEHLEIGVDDARLCEIETAFDLWEHHADRNPQARAQGEQPLSRVHHFVQQSLQRPPFGVGSGLF